MEKQIEQIPSKFVDIVDREHGFDLKVIHELIELLEAGLGKKITYRNIQLKLLWALDDYKVDLTIPRVELCFVLDNGSVTEGN